jgi:transmembrane E3 ubiquitin-protein ligase
MARWMWRTILILAGVFLLLLLPFPKSSTSKLDDIASSSSDSHRQTVDYNQALATFNYTSFEDFDPSNGHWLDLTGFREKDAFRWDLLSIVRKRTIDHVRLVYGLQNGQKILRTSPTSKVFPLISVPVYENISGYARGPWNRVNLSQNSPAESIQNASSLRSWYQSIQRNITGNYGDVHFDFDEADNIDEWDGFRVRGVNAKVSLYQPIPERSWTFEVRGLHVLDTGTVVMVTTSSR